MWRNCQPVGTPSVQPAAPVSSSRPPRRKRSVLPPEPPTPMRRNLRNITYLQVLARGQENKENEERRCGSVAPRGVVVGTGGGAGSRRRGSRRGMCIACPVAGREPVVERRTVVEGRPVVERGTVVEGR